MPYARDIRLCETDPLRGFVRERMTALKSLSIPLTRASTDVFLISYPKSGRTWHRTLLAAYISRVTNAPDEIAGDVHRLTRQTPGARMRYSHNGATCENGLPPDHPLVATPRLWAGRKVIFLVREPKDLMVSAWFHAHYRTQRYGGTIHEFVRSRLAGVQKLVGARNRWWDNHERAAATLAISYEQMHRDAGGVLRETLRFIDHWPVDEDLIGEAVERASFRSMRKEEAQAPRDASDDPDRRKVRSGKVGGYRAYLSESDIAFIDEWAARIRDPFAALYAGDPLAAGSRNNVDGAANAASGPTVLV